MIARPVHRPRPIPFDAPGHASETRSVSWASTLGPGIAAPSDIQSPAPQRLSPVKVSLASAPAPSNGATQIQAHIHTQAARRTAQAANAHDVGGPRHHQSKQASQSMTEVSARYIGHGALSVRSSVTGRHYRFQGHGDSLVIDRHDVVLLKRISDLVIR